MAMRLLLLLAVLGQWAVGQSTSGSAVIPKCDANSYLSYDGAARQYICSPSITISDTKTLTQPIQPSSHMESGAIILSVLFGGGALFGIIAVILDCIKVLKVGRTPEPTRCHTCRKSFVEEFK